MRVLVTGGAGFIGSHVVDRLRAHGHEPRIFDIVSSPYHGSDVEAVIGDLLDFRALRAAMQGCEATVHLAAMSDVNEVLADPARAEHVNATGTELLLEAARQEGTGRVVYASTIWVYGGMNGVVPLDEDAPLLPPSHIYTATKLAGELHCHAYRDRCGVQSTILRFGIPHGPRARPSTVVASFVNRARAAEPLTIRGSGRQSRQFVYVQDLADGVVAALRPQAANRTYNLVGTEQVAVRKIANAVRELVNDVPVVHAAERPGDLGTVQVSGERAARELGWRATTPFREGLARYVEWLSATNGSPSSSTASITDGSAATVARQEPGEL
jgi:UDP-glucose 4-epimerase